MISVRAHQGAAPSLGPSLRAGVTRRTPLVLWLLIVAVSAIEAWMILVTLDQPTPGQWGFRGFEAILALSFGSVGALIAARRPDNRVGWLVLWVSLVTAVEAIVNQYPVLAQASQPPLAGGDLAKWTSAWIWAIPSVSFMTFLPLIFPTGRLLDSRWRLAVWLALAAMAVQIGAVIITSRPLGPVEPTANPSAYFAEIGPAAGIGYALQLAATVAAVASAIVRYRRAVGDERQQMKWLAYAAVFLPFSAAAGFSGIFVGQLLLIASAILAAAAMAIAILRYQLYEIDVIINRTLVYGALSAVLAGVYTASITLSQRVFVAVTGERSDAAIVLTTLIVASTFTPFKTRLQSMVDRRLKPAQQRPHAEPGWNSSAGTPATSLQAFELLTSLAALRQTGDFTRDEYEIAKASLLSDVLQLPRPGRSTNRERQDLGLGAGPTARQQPNG